MPPPGRAPGAAPARGHTLAGAQPDSAVTRPQGRRPPCPEDALRRPRPASGGDLGCGLLVLTWGTVLPAFGASCASGGAVTLMLGGPWGLGDDSFLSDLWSGSLPTSVQGPQACPAPGQWVWRTPSPLRQAAPLPLFFSHAPVTSGQGGSARTPVLLRMGGGATVSGLCALRPGSDSALCAGGGGTWREA